jgi:hypothetical protein
MKLEFCRQTCEKYSYIPMKICPVGGEFFHADGRTDGWTDMKKLSFAFRNYANVPDHVSSVTKCNWTFNSCTKKRGGGHRNKIGPCDTMKIWNRNVWDTGSKIWGIWARFPADAWDFSLLRSVHNGPGAQYDPYSVCTRALSPEIKRSGREADHSPPFRTDVKNVSYWHTLYS